MPKIVDHEAYKGEILAKCFRLFAGHGYSALTMRQIAQAIEYSPTAIYLHFKDKRAVFNELCSADFLALAQEFRGIAAIPDPIERLRAVGAAYVRFGLAYPHHYRLMFMTTHPEGHEEETDVEKGNPDQDAYAFLRAIIVEAIAQGRLKPELEDPDQVSQLAWAAAHGLVALHNVKCDDSWIEWHPPRQLARQLIDVVIEGIVRKDA